MKQAFIALALFSSVAQAEVFDSQAHQITTIGGAVIGEMAGMAIAANMVPVGATMGVAVGTVMAGGAVGLITGGGIGYGVGKLYSERTRREIIEYTDGVYRATIERIAPPECQHWYSRNCVRK